MNSRKKKDINQGFSQIDNATNAKKLQKMTDAKKKQKPCFVNTQSSKLPFFIMATSSLSSNC